MSAPRSNIDKEALKQSLLGPSDRDEFKRQFQLLTRNTESVDFRTKHNTELAIALQAELYVRGQYNKEKSNYYGGNDGSIAKMIREDIEDCIEKGIITSKAEGAQLIIKYKNAIASVLDGEQQRGENMIDEIRKVVLNLRVAPPREPEPLKEQVTLDNTVVTQSTPLVNSKTQIVNMLVFIELQVAEIYGKKLSDSILNAFEKDIVAIIIQDIKECREKGYIQSDKDEYRHIRKYMEALEKNLIPIIKENNPSDTIKITTDLKQIAIHTKEETRKKIENDIKTAELKEKENMQKHLNAGKAVQGALLENAKDVYRRTYTKIAGEQKNFRQTRLFFNKELKKQEQQMISFGATKKEIQELKLGLQQESLAEQKSKASAKRTSLSTDSRVDQISKQSRGSRTH